MADNLNDIAIRLQGIIDTAIDGIITIDQLGIVESINKASASIFEYNPDEIIGNNIKMLMPEPYHSAHDGYIHHYNQTKEPRIIGIGREVTGRKKSGDLFPFRLAVSEVILNDRVIFTGIIHDLTDVKEAEAKLRNLNEELEQKVENRTNELEQVVNRLLSTNAILEKREKELNEALSKEKELNELKSRFVSMASHEFRTPLTTIMSSASLISRYSEEIQTESRQKHVEKIKSAVVNLTGILNDFLSLGKIEEGKVEVVFDDVDIPKLCHDVLDDVKGLKHKDLKLVYTNQSSIDTLHTDPRILKNILFNLISNSIKYSPMTGKVSCLTSREGDNLCFEIMDNGIGIPEAEQKHLFERFFRASNVVNIQGTGLGLSIVKRYTELIGGTIAFKSKENQGTSFKVCIPIISKKSQTP